jgi:hypothetical protein
LATDSAGSEGSHLDKKAVTKEVAVTSIDPLKITEALVLLLTTKPPPDTDAVFLHARSFGDDDGLFELSGKLLRSGTRNVVINGFSGESHHDRFKKVSPGAEKYTVALRDQGIPRDKIIWSRPATYTRDENRAFLQLAREHGWSSSTIIAQPHQVLRIMLGALKEVQIQEMAHFRLYCACPPSTDWEKAVQASQGNHRKSRFEDVGEEFKRTIRDIDKGDSATLEQLIASLRK